MWPETVMDQSELIQRLKDEENVLAFTGPAARFALPAEDKLGPFYRVDRGWFANEFRADAALAMGARVTPRFSYLVNDRTARLSGLLDEVEIDGATRRIAHAFLKTNQFEIENDPHFNLLSSFRQIFSQPALRLQMDATWRKLSPGRWCGLQEPRHFLEAHEMYHLPHLFPKVYGATDTLHIFEFYFQRRADSGNPELSYGLAHNGTEIQFRFNEDAARCIVDMHVKAVWRQKLMILAPEE